jgi:repressor LexA
MDRDSSSSKNRRRAGKYRLSPRQRQVLDFFVERIRADGLPPTVREIGEGLGMRPNSVHGHLQKLVQKRKLRRLKEGRRGYVPTSGRTCPCCGRTVVRKPAPAER